MTTPKSPRNNQEQDELIELCGVQTWSEVVEWFGDMDEDEILTEANKCWPDEDNQDFAYRIHQQL